MCQIPAGHRTIYRRWHPNAQHRYLFHLRVKINCASGQCPKKTRQSAGELQVHRQKCLEIRQGLVVNPPGLNCDWAITNHVSCHVLSMVFFIVILVLVLFSLFAIFAIKPWFSTIIVFPVLILCNYCYVRASVILKDVASKSIHDVCTIISLHRRYHPTTFLICGFKTFAANFVLLPDTDLSVLPILSIYPYS